MLQKVNKRLILSTGMLVFVAAVVAGGTGAFFSDTETSSGNVFAAGAIDLKVSNESYYNGERREDLTWSSADLDDGQGPQDDGTYLFFDYEDLKPGDWGEDTIDLVVENNPAYACMDITLAGNNDNGITEPEGKAGDETDGEGGGELQNEINFVWWIDDGDNVLEADETNTFGQLPLAELDGASVPIADSSEGSILPDPLNNDATFPDTETYYIGKAWCYGDLTLDPVAQGDNNSPTEDPGINCNGSPVGNMSQSDSATVGLSFFAVQSRNNDGFRCDQRGQEEPEPPEVADGDIFESLSAGMRVKAQGGEGIYLGEFDLGDGVNREQASIGSMNNNTGSYPFTLAYTAATNEMTLNGPNGADLTWDIDDAPATCSAWDGMLIQIKDSRSDAALALENLDLGGNSLSNLGVFDVAGTPSWQSWSITNFDFLSDWTLTGDIKVENFTGNEDLKMQIMTGCTS